MWAQPSTARGEGHGPPARLASSRLAGCKTSPAIACPARLSQETWDAAVKERGTRQPSRCSLTSSSVVRGRMSIGASVPCISPTSLRRFVSLSSISTPAARPRARSAAGDQSRGSFAPRPPFAARVPPRSRARLGRRDRGRSVALRRCGRSPTDLCAGTGPRRCNPQRARSAERSDQEGVEGPGTCARRRRGSARVRRAAGPRGRPGSATRFAARRARWSGPPTPKDSEFFSVRLRFRSGGSVARPLPGAGMGARFDALTLPGATTSTLIQSASST